MIPEGTKRPDQSKLLGANAKLHVSCFLDSEQEEARRVAFDATFAQFHSAINTQRCIFEICTSSDSSIGEVGQLEFQDCLVLRITLQHCFQSKEGCEGVKQLLWHAYNRYGQDKVLLWFSLPCTGGCAFWNMILEEVDRDADIKTMRRYNYLPRQHQLLMSSALSLLEYATTLGNGTLPHIAHEWPKSCKYWKSDLVVAYVQKFQLNVTLCDGCMMGVISRHGTNKGKPIKKSWLIKTNNGCVSNALSVQCDRSHDYVPCQGQDTRQTERYPHRFAVQLHTGWSNHCLGR